MKLIEAIGDFLPSKLSKTLLLLTIALASTPFLLPESVISEIHWTPKAQLLLLKSAVSLLLLLIGSSLILLVEIRWRLREKASADASKQFDEANGVWRDTKTGLCYCVKCKITPLRVVERGWYCGACSLVHDSAEYIEKVRRKREEENARVRAYNQRGGGWMSR